MNVSYLLRNSVKVISILFIATSIQAAELYFVDAHSQFDQSVNLNDINTRLADNDISKVILSTRGSRSPYDAVPNTDWPAGLAEKVVPAMRSKGDRYINNDPSFYEWFNNQLSSGSFRAVAEALVYHAEKFDQQGNSIAPAVIIADFDSDARVLQVIDAAKTLAVPVVLHLEFGSIPAYERQTYLAKLESILQSNPETPFVMIHMAQLGIGDVMRLILRNDNIFFMTSHSDPVSVEASNQPWTPLFKGNVLAPLWRDAFIHFPNRFIFALDTVYAENWSADVYNAKMDYWRSAVANLPEAVRDAFTHGNAECLWKLVGTVSVNPLCQSGGPE